MNELKPCPFCGSNDISFEWTMTVCDIPYEGYMECHSCEMTGPTCVSTDEDSGDCEEITIAYWNNRHIPEGYVIVPVEPNALMIRSSSEFKTRRSIYKAMIAASQEQ